MKKIAIIGSGISGMSAAWLLNQKYDVTLFEKNSRLGGHSNTATINYPRIEGGNKEIAVDTGFIVYNFRTYHHLKQLFELLKVEIVESKMSFGIKDYSSNLEYLGSDLGGIFAQKKNLLNPKFWGMIFDILKFNKRSISLVESGNSENQDINLWQFIEQLKMGEYFKKYYLLPMASAIWSCPVELMKNYPAKTFLRFFYNHGLLTVTNQPQWYSVKGGSKEYIKKLTASFRNKIRSNTEITNCFSSEAGVILEEKNGTKHQFDEVIFACHANETFEIISDKSDLEKEILSKFQFSKNHAILHRDSKQMPKNKKAWGSWVYLSQENQKKTSLTYWMNNLQAIDSDLPLFVTLNPIKEIDADKIFAEFDYEHPIFDEKAIVAQERLPEIQGKRGIYFIGAWTKYGFHEDGISSAINLTNNYFEVKAPWQK